MHSSKQAIATFCPVSQSGETPKSFKFRSGIRITGKLVGDIHDGTHQVDITPETTAEEGTELIQEGKRNYEKGGKNEEEITRTYAVERGAEEEAGKKKDQVMRNTEAKRK